MYPVMINGDLLDQLISQRFPRGVSELQSVWDDQGGPDRTTLYRWRKKGGLPKSSEDYLRLCGLLNVDPFSLLATSENEFHRVVDRLTEAHQDNSATFHPALKFIEEFMGRKRVWPPTDLLESFYTNFVWFTEEFEYTAGDRRFYYQCLELSGDTRLPDMHPQVFHFAFRHPSLFGKRWLQYGYLVRTGLGVQLIHINGHSEKYEVRQGSDPTFVETFFGDGPAIFRIASIHPFSLRLSGEQKAPGNRVRFPS